MKMVNAREVDLNATESVLVSRFNELLSEGHGIAHAAMLTFEEFLRTNSNGRRWTTLGWQGRISPAFVAWLSEHTVKFYPLTLTLLYVEGAPIEDGCDLTQSTEPPPPAA